MNYLLLAEMNVIPMLLFAVFLAIAIGAWVMLDVFFNNKTRSESRLEMMKERAAGGAQSITKQSTTAKEGITKLLEKASPSLGDKVGPKTEKEASKMKQKLDAAGFRGENAIPVLSTIKVIAAIIGFVLGGGATIFAYGLATKSIMYTLMVTGVAFFVPETILGFIGSSRKEKIFLGLPDALDLMVVCVEAGLGMDQAMRKVSEELEATHPTIATEFKICNQALQYGSTRETVLQELGERNGVEDLQTLSSILIQVDKFGTSVGQALRTQSEAMRTRRRQMAEEKAAKTAVKLIFPLVLFIFPGIFVVLVGPAAITMVNEMLPAFQK